MKNWQGDSAQRGFVSSYQIFLTFLFRVHSNVFFFFFFFFFLRGVFQAVNSYTAFVIICIIFAALSEDGANVGGRGNGGSIVIGSTLAYAKYIKIHHNTREMPIGSHHNTATGKQHFSVVIGDGCCQAFRGSVR